MSFLDFAKQHGLDISLANFYPSDKIRRCGTIDKPKSDNGAYLWDGKRGWVMNWAMDAKVHYYHDKNATPWTDAEKREWRRKRQEAAKAKAETHKTVAAKAAETLREATPKSHIYLDVKGFRDAQGLVKGDKLLIPMRNVRTNELTGYQEIWWDRTIKGYQKKMLYGMKAAESVFYLGKARSNEYWLVEGYATGLSVKDALKRACIDATVVICFSANNLVAVSKLLDGEKFVFADNDKSGAGESAAKATGLRYAMSDVEGWDANDVHRIYGILILMEIILKVRLDTA